MSHIHKCPHGCDECREGDCKNRDSTVIPPCGCRCHMRCFQLQHPSGEAASFLAELTRINDGGGSYIEARTHAEWEAIHGKISVDAPDVRALLVRSN